MNYYDGSIRWSRTCCQCKKEYYISHDDERERWGLFERTGEQLRDLCPWCFADLINEYKGEGPEGE